MHMHPLTLLHAQLPFHCWGTVGTWMAYAGLKRAQCRSVASLRGSKKQCPPAGDQAGTLQPSPSAVGWGTGAVVVLWRHYWKKIGSDCGPAVESHWYHGGCREDICDISKLVLALKLITMTHYLNFPIMQFDMLTSEGYTFDGSSARKRARGDCCSAWTAEYAPSMKALWAAMMFAATVYSQSFPCSSSATSGEDSSYH